MSDEHERLLRKVMICKPEDYEPWGELKRWGKPDDRHADCSTGCKFARWLEDVKIEGDQHYLSMDWCVCTNPKSHRVGLLTFEHQGCPAFESDPEIDEEEERELASATEHDPLHNWDPAGENITLCGERLSMVSRYTASAALTTCEDCRACLRAKP